MSPSRHALLLALTLALIACAEDVPVTTEPDRVHTELEHTLRVAPASGMDLLIVLEPTERSAALPLVRSRVQELITGDADGDGVSDYYAESPLSVTTLTMEELQASAQNSPEFPHDWRATCPTAEPCFPELPTARYRYQPYGFAPSIRAFLSDVDCALSDAPQNCLPPPDVNDLPWHRFGTGGISAVTLNELRTWTPMEFAAALKPVCAAGTAPWSPGAHAGFDRVVRDADGFAECELRETLPTRGPITTCETLSDFGRTFDHVDDEGHEVCLIQQLPPNHATQDAHGFYYYEGRTPSWASLSPTPSATPEQSPLCPPSADEGPRLLMNDNTPFVMPTTVEIRCALIDANTPLAPRAL